MRVKDPAKTALIHQATLRLVLQSGIDGLKMADIAREAGIATGTLYVYFESKEVLLSQLYETMQAECLRLLPAGKESQPFRAVFKEAFVAAQQYWVNQYAAAVFIDLFYHSAFITPEAKVRPLPLDAYFTALLDGAKAQWLVKDLDTELLLCAVTGLLRQSAMYCTRSGRKLTKPLLEKLFTLCWDTIKA